MTPRSVLEDAGIHTFRSRLAEEAEMGGELILDEVSASTDKAELQIRRMAGRWRIDILERVQPAAVESRIKAELPGHEGVVLSGQADLLALTYEGDGVLTLRDLKTGKRKMPAIKHAPQLGSYSLLWRTQGHEPQHASIDFLQRVPSTKEQPAVDEQPLDIYRCEGMAYAVIDDMASKARRLSNTGDPSHILTNPGSMLCSAKFCRAHGLPICPATRD